MIICSDLHLHTTASDGDLTPAELVSLACDCRLKTIAVTDHDTTSGVPEALAAGESSGMRVIPGVEISAVFEPGTMHILGYFKEFPINLEKELKVLQDARARRLPRMMEKLNELGCRVDINDVLAIAGDAQVGRPHVAKALIDRGYARDYEQAFSRYLAKGRPAYVEKEMLQHNEAIEMIKDNGGIAVLAHPFTLDLDNWELAPLIHSLKLEGLDGIEIFYPDHTKAQLKKYKKLASEFELVATGGTDFHGPCRNKLSPGDYGIDENHMEIIENLINLPR